MASSLKSDLEAPVHLDGRMLEGGGQLLRLALSLSSVTRTPVHITDIRGNRKGRQDGGLKPSHLAGAAWLANATQATTRGLELKSRELMFRPSRETRSEVDVEEALEKLSIQTEGLQQNGAPIWKDIKDAEGVRRRQTTITMSSPGSVNRVLQAMLPYLLFGSQIPSFSDWSDQQCEEPLPLRLEIVGGTNVSNSPSHEYTTQVLFPMLQQKVGIGSVSATLAHRGWSAGPRSMGKVTIDITPLKVGSTLPAFDFSDRGELVKIHCSILASTTDLLKEIHESVLRWSERRHPGVEVLFPVSELTGHRARLYLLLVAETSHGYRLGRDWLVDRKLNPDNPRKTAATIVDKVTADLAQELAHGGCVDEFLQDQLTVFQALARGRSTVAAGPTSLHTETTRWVCEKVLGIAFADDGGCDGIGYVAGQGA